MPAVAGRNAMRERSIYTDWNKVHASAAGLSVESRTQPRTTPIHSQQVQGLRSKREAGEIEEGEVFEGAFGQAWVGPIGHRVSLSTNTIPRANMPTSLNQKAVKLDTISGRAGPDVNTPLNEESAEIQAIKSAIPDLCQIIAILMKDQGALMKKQAQAHEDLLRQVLTLPQVMQERFQRPIAEGTQTLVKTAVGSNKVRGMIDDVRKKLIDANLGSLLIPMDREFCTPTTEVEEEEAEGM